jgi:hypothetical protein
MYHIVDKYIDANRKASLCEYVIIPSLECAETLYDVLNNVSFSSTPIENDGQFVYLKYAE